MTALYAQEARLPIRTRPSTQMPSTPYRQAAEVWRQYQARTITAAQARRLIAPPAWAARLAQVAAVPFARTDPLGYAYIRVWWWDIIQAARFEASHTYRYALPPRPPPSRSLQQQVYVARWQANALCQALWACQHGERRWLDLRLTVQSSVAAAVGEDVARSTAPPSGDAHTTGSVGGVSEYPDVRVPACREIGYGGEVLRLLRADLSNLEQDWGVDRVRRIYHLRRRMGFEPGQSQSLDELALLALGHAGRPDLALSWYAYLHAPRMGNVFFLHAGQGVRASVQRRSNQDRELGEAALEIVRAVRGVG